METSKVEIPKATPPIDTGAAAPEPQASAQPRRGRGRPFGARTKASPLQETLVPPENGEAPQDAAPRQQRKRKQSVDIGLLAKQLKGIHELAGNLIPIKMPNGSFLVSITDLEATQLAEAIAAVAKEYDLALDGKTGAAIQLLSAAVMIYGPRVYMLNKFKQEMARQQQEAKRAAAMADPSVVAESTLNGHAATN